ncbi:NADH:ubiquinone oxidoreductase subunit NDUFA12 [Paracoccus sp. (in: a-proteobacteria)]|uniref:NADH:ubiquinone oxidoreductase subunit NDUFA12 n=1 Tax=Paracoccus sp. TaxID=267 RepID=UPI0026DFD3C4|nr:NADH:ubiquinone oxidoreductase subunit NDUFA12 [Paracoccus sp. (in: a-proteobacteria)]MDO5648031.1 NADH:ubiquinone oxidoreductase subunit NDUFA12 [Paracoccus sp. (in: a-proteobacteria)]
MNFLLRFLTWWNGQTLNTQFWTWRNGVKVGEDAEGNLFYQTKDGARRWVIYNGEAQASRISPDWHGWLHHTFAEPPTKDPMQNRDWQLPHQENLTGTPGAYVPDGSLYQVEPTKRRDYDAWRPE